MCYLRHEEPGTRSRIRRPRCGKCGAALPWITESGDDEFDEIVEDAAIPVLVDMWAEWCGPSRMVSPALEQVARDLSGRLKLVKVNVDTSPVLACRFGVQTIPTFLPVDGGTVVAGRARTGAAPLGDLRRWVDSSLPSRTRWEDSILASTGRLCIT